MRLLHTSDWHLGHTLHDFSREDEHQAFLQWLLSTVGERAVDVLLVAGDLFDTSNPSAAAQRLLYEFLAQLHQRYPSLQTILLGGNHDSADRLDAPDSLLRVLGVQVVGGLRPQQGWGRCLVPLRGVSGEVEGWCVAVPYLRPADLPVGELSQAAGISRRYHEVFEELDRVKSPGQVVVATGHLYMAGGEISELSERRIQVGNQQVVSADIFPPSVDYVALGHLHKAQRVGGKEHVRYCGSPIPLALDEASYTHQVCLVDLIPGQPTRVEVIPVPRWVDIIRVPARGSAPLEEVVRQLRVLPPASEGEENARRPWLSVKVELTGPEPGLRPRLEEALKGKNARLVRIQVENPSQVLPGEEPPLTELRTLVPEEVFVKKYARQYKGNPPGEELLTLFRQVLEEVQGAS